VFAAESRAAFVEHAWQDDIAAETNASAARRTLREINKVVWHIID
jgi:hypothetical protein